jgi:hypothetical protein
MEMQLVAQKAEEEQERRGYENAQAEANAQIAAFQANHAAQGPTATAGKEDNADLTITCP